MRTASGSKLLGWAMTEEGAKLVAQKQSKGVVVGVRKVERLNGEEPYWEVEVWTEEKAMQLG